MKLLELSLFSFLTQSLLLELLVELNIFDIFRALPYFSFEVKSAIYLAVETSQGPIQAFQVEYVK